MGTIPGFVFPFYIIGSDPRLIHLSTRISGGKQWIRVEKSETGIISLEFFERFFKAPRKPDPDRIQTSPGDLWKSGCLSRRILWNFNWISNPPESFSEKDGRNFSTESTAPKKATTISSLFYYYDFGQRPSNTRSGGNRFSESGKRSRHSRLPFGWLFHPEISIIERQDYSPLPESAGNSDTMNKSGHNPE